MAAVRWLAGTTDESGTGSGAPNPVEPNNGETVEPGTRAPAGFGARSTAEEVVRGIDLSGRLALVTGGYSGIGREAVTALARAGARVVVPARRPAVAREALSGVDGAEVDELDLADLDSVRAFADRFLGSGRSIDIMMNNAGIMACPLTRVGPGWEAQFGVNHLGHYALVNLLWPAISRNGGARVVVLTSRAQHPAAIRWSDPHFRTGYDKWQAYAQAKRANVLFAERLDVLGRGVGVRAFSVHPGHILSPLQRYLGRAEMVAAGWVDEDGNLVDPGFKTPQQGAATQVWAATSPRLAGTGGRYCEDCAVVDQESDPEGAARLWTLSAELTGVDAFTDPT